MKLNELRPDILRRTILAGKHAFVVGHNRMRAEFDNVAVNAAHETYDRVMEAIDRAYGTCLCMDLDTAGDCPSFEQHSVAAGFIDEMELIGQHCAVVGIPLSKRTINAQLDFLLYDRVDTL